MSETDTGRKEKDTMFFGTTRFGRTPFGRKLLIGALAFGTVAGYASGIASLSRCANRHEARRAALEAHVADVCTRAALRAHEDDAGRGHRHGPRW